MKKNKILIYTLAILIFLIILSVIFLSIAGSIKRTAYMTDFELKEKNETSYTYSFKIRYYSKIFRNSDIYGVYVKNIDNLSDYISNLNFEKNGSPFGTLESPKEILNNHKIENVNYTLKIKNIFYLYITALLAILIYIMFRKKILIKYKTLIKYISESSVCKYLSNTDKPLPIDYILFGIVAVLCTFSYVYSDMFITFPFAINFWNVNPFNFFNEVHTKVGSFHIPDVYPYITYLVYAVFLFPLWIYSKIKGITFYTWHHDKFEPNMTEFIYIKILLFLFILLSAFLIYKIAKQVGINKNKSKFVSFIFMSSFFTIVPTIIGHYDIIMIFFMLLGIKDYLNNNKRYLLWFAIAIPLKFFALFILIPLVLLKEKRYFNIIKNIIISLLPYILTTIITKHPNNIIPDSVMEKFPMLYQNANIFKADMFSRMISNTISRHSIFIIIYGLICCFAFLKNCENEYEFNRFAIYISMFVFLLFPISMIGYHTYWIVMPYTFIILAIFLKPKYLEINLLLELLGSFCLMLHLIREGTFISVSEAIRSQILPIRLFNLNIETIKYNTIRDVFPNFFANKDIMLVVYSVFVTALICILILTFPKKSDNGFNEEKINRGVVWLRFIPTLLCVFVVYFLLFKNI